MRLRVSRRAERELGRIRDYIARDRPRAAAGVVARLYAAVRMLAEQPMLGRQVTAAGSRQWPVRGLPYIVIYRIDQSRGEVVVLSIFHGARQR